MSSLFDFIVKPNYINTTLALSDEKFDLLTKNYVPRVKTVLDLCRSSSWGGSCLGMTDVAAIHYISPYKLPFLLQLHMTLLPLSMINPFKI